jgi:hypothetical protein
VVLAGALGVDSLSGNERVGVNEPHDNGLFKMIVELELPARVNVGEPVPMRLKVRNDGAEPAELALTGSPIAFDIVVEQLDGTEVWRRLRGDAVSMMLQVTILQPGQSLEFTHRWDQRDTSGRAVRAGTYTVGGSVSTPDGKLESKSRRLVISG